MKMHQQPEEIQVEPDFAIYQSSYSGTEESRLDYFEESDGIQLCNQPWIDIDDNAYDLIDEQEDINREFISIEALKMPDKKNESCDGDDDLSALSEGHEQRKRKLSNNIIVLDSDDEDEGENNKPNQFDYGKQQSKRQKRSQNDISDEDDDDDDGDDDDGDDVILIEDDENETGFSEDRNTLTESNANASIVFNEMSSPIRIDYGAYECCLCGKRVASSYNLKRHMMIHTGERPFGCDICDKRFREFSDFKKHRRIHSADPAYKCMVCMINAPALMNPTKCSQCDQTKIQGPPQSSLIKNSTTLIETASSNSTTTLVINRSSTAVSTATSTSRNFATKSTSNRNLIGMNSASSATMASSFANEITAENFQYTEEGVNKKGYNCPICDRIFGSRHNLKRHFMIHTGEKPFSCDVCDKTFREYSTLKKHALTHQRLKFYHCEICGEEFNNYATYTAHTIRHSANINTNNFNYDDEDPLTSSSDIILPTVDEDSTFLFKNNLFHCIACEKTFKEQEKLNAHLVVHRNGIKGLSKNFSNIDDVSITMDNSLDCYVIDERQ